VSVLDTTSALEALIAVHGEALLDVAVESIRHRLVHDEPLPVVIQSFPSALAESGASFVTLHRDRELRGCIGTAQPWRALIADVAANACAAAFEDPRFDSINMHEIDALEIELSLLGPAVPLAVFSEVELLAALRPGRDGLILSEGSRRGLFLPAVWDSVNGPADFVRHLKEKAGIAKWSSRVTVHRFETRSVTRSPSLPP